MSNLNLEKMQEKGQKFLSELADIIESYELNITSFQNEYPLYKKCKIKDQVTQAEWSTYIPKVANDAYFGGYSWGEQSLGGEAVETETEYKDDIEYTVSEQLSAALNNMPNVSEVLDDYIAPNVPAESVGKCNAVIQQNYTNALRTTMEKLKYNRSALFALMENIQIDQEVINETIDSTNAIIQNLETEIFPIKQKLQALYGGDLTSVGMLTDATYLYNQQLTGTCLIGILTAAAGVGIFLNWKSMRTN